MEDPHFSTKSEICDAVNASCKRRKLEQKAMKKADAESSYFILNNPDYDGEWKGELKYNGQRMMREDSEKGLKCVFVRLFRERPDGGLLNFKKTRITSTRHAHE